MFLLLLLVTIVFVTVSVIPAPGTSGCKNLKPAAQESSGVRAPTHPKPVSTNETAAVLQRATGRAGLTPRDQKQTNKAGHDPKTLNLKNTGSPTRATQILQADLPNLRRRRVNIVRVYEQVNPED